MAKNRQKTIYIRDEDLWLFSWAQKRPEGVFAAIANLVAELLEEVEKTSE